MAVLGPPDSGSSGTGSAAGFQPTAEFPLNPQTAFQHIQEIAADGAMLGRSVLTDKVSLLLGAAN